MSRGHRSFISTAESGVLQFRNRILTKGSSQGTANGPSKDEPQQRATLHWRRVAGSDTGSARRVWSFSLGKEGKYTGPAGRTAGRSKTRAGDQKIKDAVWWTSENRGTAIPRLAEPYFHRSHLPRTSTHHRTQLTRPPLLLRPRAPPTCTSKVRESGPAQEFWTTVPGSPFKPSINHRLPVLFFESRGHTARGSPGAVHTPQNDRRVGSESRRTL